MDANTYLDAKCDTISIRSDLKLPCKLCRSVGTTGYGKASWKGVQYRAHRLRWIAVYGSIPEGLHVCHKCDQPSCTEISHLFVGTHKDNMADKSAKGRNGATYPRICKLTEEQVREIRELGKVYKYRELAAMYDVSFVTISQIMTRRTWAHLKP